MFRRGQGFRLEEVEEVRYANKYIYIYIYIGVILLKGAC